MGLQEGSPSPKRRPRRLDIENIEQSPEPRAGTPPRLALGDVTPGHNAQASMSPTWNDWFLPSEAIFQAAAYQSLHTSHKPAPWLMFWLRR